MIIGLTGKKQSGKTEASKGLKGFKLINFKDALIEEIKDGFPDLLEGIKDEYNLSNDTEITVENLFSIKPFLMRTLMQNYGTDVRRKDDKDYWVNRWLDSIHYGDGDILADDVRFENEAKAVRTLGGIIIRIHRPSLEVGTDFHPTETEMDKIKVDHLIINDGTIKDLQEKIYAIQKISKGS